MAERTPLVVDDGGIRQIQSDDSVLLPGQLNLGASSSVTIASGAVTITSSLVSIDTEAAAATDDLTDINGGRDGDFIVIRAADSARTVVVRNTGNIRLESSPKTLDNSQDVLTLLFDGTNWREVKFENNAA